MRYIPAKNHGGTPNQPIRRIVMHGTVTPCGRGWALQVAHMFATTSRDASTQKVHDPGTSIRCVPDNVVAYGAPPNTGALHHELTDPQAGSGARWQDADHQSMLQLAAADVARDATRYKIPVKHIGPADLLRGARGICGHKDVSLAWGLTNHVDPGPDFPWSQFLALVRAYQKNPHPPTGDDEMPDVVAKSYHEPQALVAGAWKVLAVQTIDGTPSPSMVKGPARVEGTVTIYLGHPASGPVTVNAYQAGVVDGKLALVDTAGTAQIPPGVTQFQFQLSRSIPAGRLLRIRVMSPEDNTVTYVRHDLSTWKG